LQEYDDDWLRAKKKIRKKRVYKNKNKGM